MTCSVAWDDAGLPAWGSAPRASFWVALEQNGPWGNKAFTQSRLDPRLGAAIEDAAADAGGKALLIRRPASHADTADHRQRRVYVAARLAGEPWLLAGEVADPSDVLVLPFAALAEAGPSDIEAAVPWLRAETGGVLLVCANAKRDLCCALRGRPIALDAEAARPGRVWECTHTGGHRFAPTGVVLPSGQSLGRITPELALAALDAADSGRLAALSFGPWHDRGRGHLSPAEAVAEAHIRELTGETGPAALRTRDVLPGQVAVTHADGRTWTVRVARQTHPDALPESCAKPPVAAYGWSPEVVAESLT